MTTKTVKKKAKRATKAPAKSPPKASKKPAAPRDADAKVNASVNKLTDRLSTTFAESSSDARIPYSLMGPPPPPAIVEAAASAETPETVLVLRTCRSDMSAHGWFKWPASGDVSAPDWKPIASCGNGLHGLLWGQGDVNHLAMHGADAKWLVVEVAKNDVIDLGGKVKFPRGNVVACGSRDEAVEFLSKRAPSNVAVAYAKVTVGDRGTATAGYGGTATAGYGGTATAGYGGTATAGYGGTATAGDRGTATAGYGGTATAGDRGTATAGDRGTATAGESGTATAGYGGTATAGYGGTATAGDRGTATAGESGQIFLSWWDGKRTRTAVGYIGEDGLEPKVAYKLDEAHKFTRVEPAKPVVVLGVSGAIWTIGTTAGVVAA